MQLTDISSTTSLANKIRMMKEQPAMIVIDTINRNYGPGDENNTADMTKAIASLDILRNLTGATILGVHHSGHAEKGRGRGSSVLLASVDCEFAVERFNQMVQMRCTKAKDFDHPPPLAWNLERQQLPWADEAGYQINSAVLIPNELQPDEHSEDARLGASQKKALEILQTLQQRNRERRESSGFELTNIGVAKNEWYEAMEKAGIPKNRRSDARSDLERRRIIHVSEDNFIFILREQDARPWAEN
jgi:RecA-family ATPase